MNSIQPDQLERALRHEPFAASDRVFCRLLKESFAEENAFVLAAGSLCLSAVREGHSFFDLASPQLPGLLYEALGNSWPTVAEWAPIAKSSQSIGRPGDDNPLILDGETALYLHRYFDYETELADRVSIKASQLVPASLAYSNASLISDSMQADSVEKALKNRFYLISGGPGTGKTTTVLAYLLECIQGLDLSYPLRIAVAAPTGKAAARVSNSIRDGLARFDLEGSVEKKILSIPCLTIHRLLEAIPGKTSFRRNQKRPLEYDILIVDESSMIDLPLMKKLMDAVPGDSSILLLGDDNQLSSVEVGSVFGDLVRSTNNHQSPLFGKSTHLAKTFRFTPDSSIFRLCQACNDGHSGNFRAILEGKHNDLNFQTLKKTTNPSLTSVLNLAEEALQRRAQSEDLAQAFGQLSQFIALAPLNNGPYGANAINRLTEEKIRRKHNLPSVGFYSGQPLLVLENNYDLRLFNGDLGIVWPDESGELFAWFNESEGAYRKIRTNWLPRHSTAHCLTIHKSQGSEFEHVAGVFSPEDTEFVTRELIYTCVSRAKSEITLFGNIDALCTAVSRRVNRATRLDSRILESTKRLN